MAEIPVLEQKITVLYVEGRPRWEYRYIKSEMIRDKTVDISCILTSAEPNYAQAHTEISEPATYRFFPFNTFPTKMDQLMECDVVLFGDVDRRDFTDAQLQLISDFVGKKGGGFGMIAGEQWSPGSYRETPIDRLLPVRVTGSEPQKRVADVSEGFRPVLTRDGAASPMYRFYDDPKENEVFVKETLLPMYWYCGLSGKLSNEGIRIHVKRGAVALAEHPTDAEPDGSKAPLLVVGRFGAGQTLFSAYDETWRWRFYTGQSHFDSYWIQQLRYLARNRKLCRKRVTLCPDRASYHPGQRTVHLTLRIYDPELLPKLSGKMTIKLIDARTKAVVRTEILQNSPDRQERYVGSFPADRAGIFRVAVVEPALQARRLDDETIEVTDAGENSEDESNLGSCCSSPMAGKSLAIAPWTNSSAVSRRMPGKGVRFLCLQHR